MTALSNVSAYQTRNTYATSGVSRSGPPPQAEQQLDSVLKDSGLSSSDQASLKSDLQSALQDQFSSGSFPPDTTKLQSTIKDVFSKYGLDSDKLADRLGPPGGGAPPFGGGFGGGPGGPQGTGKANQQTSTLLDLLTKSSSDSTDDSTNDSASTGSTSSESNSTASTTSSSTTALKQYLDQLLNQYGKNASDTSTSLVHILVGFDASA